MKTKLYIACFASLLLSFTNDCYSADELANNWHQWRGPLGTGASHSAQPPLRWSETQNVKWKVAIEGKGTSTPIIWGDYVFILTTVETEVKDSSIPDPENQPKTNFFNIKRPNRQHEFIVICLDRKSGAQIWRRVATKKIPHEGAHHDNDFASASPTTDGKRLFCWFGSAGLFCFNLQGELLWERDLGEVAVGSSLGEGSSPTLYEDRLIIVRDHRGSQSAIEVLNTETGNTVWKQERDEGNAWATPVVTAINGKTQVLTAASNFIRSYDLNTGEVIWQCSGLTGNVTPCPIVYGDSVLCMSGYQGYSAMAIALTGSGDISGSNKIRWSKNRGTPYVPSPVLHNGKLYYTQSNQSILTCVDAASGSLVFGPERIGQVSNIYSSLVAAENRIYITGRKGRTLVVSDKSEFEELAVNQLDERFDASPAMAGKQLFLRGEKYLYCLEED